MSSIFHLSWLAALKIVFNNNASLLFLTLLQAGLLRIVSIIYLFSQTPAGLRICQVAWHPSAVFQTPARTSILTREKNNPRPANLFLQDSIGKYTNATKCICNLSNEHQCTVR